MACSAEISTSTEHTIFRKHRNKHKPISDSVPNSKPRSRSSNNGFRDGIDLNSDHTAISPLIGRHDRKSGKSISGFGGMGCASVSSTPVTAPEVIRTAADWRAKEVRKKKVKTSRNKARKVVAAREGISADVCCGPGIGFAADAALVDCVDSRRPVGPRTNHRPVDCMDSRRPVGPRTNHRQRSAATRVPITFEDVPILNYQSAFSGMQVQTEETDMSSGRQINRWPLGGLPEILMLEDSPSFQRSFGLYDQFGGWRLDVDRMSYEELLALSDRIGYVGTGLREEEINRCLRKTKQSVLESLPLLFSDDKNWRCSICQETYEEEDEVGKLECNHFYHMQCIKQWLLRKNACPVCKTAAASAHV